MRHALERVHDPAYLDRFIELCGGKEARVGIIPTASELEDTGRNYEKLFRKLGIRHAQVLKIETRQDCQSDEALDYLDRADGVFMTGGNQLRLSTTIGGTAIAQALRRRNAEGMHVAGTSAGAAFMPEHMIAGGREGSTPSPDMVTMAPGLGLTNKFIIDQHFRERDRLGRLLTALAYNPFAVGLGLEEDRATHRVHLDAGTGVRAAVQVVGHTVAVAVQGATVAVDLDGRVWIGTLSKGVLVFEDDAWITFDRQSSDLSNSSYTGDNRGPDTIGLGKTGRRG